MLDVNSHLKKKLNYLRTTHLNDLFSSTAGVNGKQLAAHLQMFAAEKWI